MFVDPNARPERSLVMTVLKSYKPKDIAKGLAMFVETRTGDIELASIEKPAHHTVLKSSKTTRSHDHLNSSIHEQTTMLNIQAASDQPEHENVRCHGKIDASDNDICVFGFGLKQQELFSKGGREIPTGEKTRRLSMASSQIP
jgi:hypothetical protein